MYAVRHVAHLSQRHHTSFGSSRTRVCVSDAQAQRSTTECNTIIRIINDYLTKKEFRMSTNVDAIRQEPSLRCVFSWNIFPPKAPCTFYLQNKFFILPMDLFITLSHGMLLDSIDVHNHLMFTAAAATMPLGSVRVWTSTLWLTSPTLAVWSWNACICRRMKVKRYTSGTRISTERERWTCTWGLRMRNDVVAIDANVCRFFHPNRQSKRNEMFIKCRYISSVHSALHPYKALGPFSARQTAERTN